MPAMRFDFDVLYDIRAARRLLEEAADPNVPHERAMLVATIANAAATLALAQIQYQVMQQRQRDDV